MFKRFIAYYKPHKLVFGFDMLASLVVSLIGIVYPIVTREMLNDLIPNRNYRMVVIFGLGLLGLYIVRMLLNYFIHIFSSMYVLSISAVCKRHAREYLLKIGVILS